MLWSPCVVQSQTLVRQDATDTFSDYVLRNDSLNVDYRFELTIPFAPGRQTWRILEQEIVEIPRSRFEADFLELILADAPTASPVAHPENPGFLRKQQVASLMLHVVRVHPTNPSLLLVTRNLRVRIYTEPIWETSSAVMQRQALSNTSGDSPLANGTWYRIPLTRDGIYQLDRNYLQSLGMPVATLDPRNIQIWTTNGYELPLPNAAERAQLQQIPILVTGEADGRLDAADVVLFYGNSVNRYLFDEQTGTYSHRVHPYSARNFVFITVGSTAGTRLTETNITTPASTTITTFRDFIWKEEELRRPDNRTKSGTQWLGQQFSTEAFAKTQTILRDTLSGFVQGSDIDIVVEFAARSMRNSRFDVRFGTNLLGSVTTPGIINPTSSTARAATTARLNRTISGASLSGDIFELTATFENTLGGSFGWLDWIRIRATRELRPKQGLLHYFTPDGGQSGTMGNFMLTGFTNTPLVMDVTDPASPVMYRVESAGNSFTVRHTTAPGRRFVAQTQFLRPAAGSSIPNQNLRGITAWPNYIIVTSEALLAEANALATYRAEGGEWRPVVVTQQQIFNEFSGGVPDITAIRDYVRFLYVRAGLDSERIPRHLLLFGNTTFDFKGIQTDARMTNHVFSFQSEESYERVISYGSDDFYVLLDTNEGLWTPTATDTPTFERIDMGVGRLPVQTRAEAALMVDKIKLYENPSTFGDWRTLFTFSSDDDINGTSIERDLHVWNADGTAERINRDQSGVRVNKVYQISYPVINSPLGRLAPEATQAFINSINNGTLVMNFSGHGAEQLLTAEQLFRSEDILRLNNRERPTIFVTATCDFGRYDDTDDYSGAEKLMLWRNGGSVAAFTTTRVVFTSSSTTSYNFGLNIQLTQQMVQRDADGLPQTLGDIYRNTKNTTVGATFNSRKFVLLGDPAMRIGLPRSTVAISDINGTPPATGAQPPIALRALDQATISGNLLNPDGSVNTAFNGEATIQVFDADRFVELPNFERRETAGCYTPGCQYRTQNDVIFSGRVSVSNGSFSSRFIIPNDIAYSDTTGRILIYGKDNQNDAVGSFSNIIFNGRNPNAVNDNRGPGIQIFLNDTDFSDGGIVGDSPRLIVLLDDQSGINTAGAGVGHELVAYLTQQSGGREQTLILNNFYRSELDDFTSGRVEYPLDRLTPGIYTLRVRAWDVFNNVNEEEISFEVTSGEDLRLRNVYNYPNPMSSYTRFIFEHNQAGREMDITIRVFTLSGRPVARIQRSGLITSGNLVQIDWDGRDDDRNLLAAGTYLYHVQVRGTANGSRQTQEKIERLVIIR